MRRIMKRMTILLAVAAFTVAMMLASAVPAFAGGNSSPKAEQNGNFGMGGGECSAGCVGGATGGGGSHTSTDLDTGTITTVGGCKKCNK
jgi:hypothetical protein